MIPSTNVSDYPPKISPNLRNWEFRWKIIHFFSTAVSPINIFFWENPQNRPRRNMFLPSPACMTHGNRWRLLCLDSRILNPPERNLFVMGSSATGIGCFPETLHLYSPNLHLPHMFCQHLSEIFQLFSGITGKYRSE